MLQMDVSVTDEVLFDNRWRGMGDCQVASPILRRSAWAIRAATAAVGGFSLLTVLVYVADEHPAFEAGTRTLQASVVSLNGVVVIISGWVRVGCARLCGVHKSSLWAGLRGVRPPAGPFLFSATKLYYY
jgi:hypothetical protein